MRRPRYRLRTLMIVVALIAVLVGIPLNWLSWLRGVDSLPFSWGVQAHLLPLSHSYIAGQTIPVQLDYEFELGSPRPPPGMFFRVKLETKVQDQATGAVIDRQTIYQHLVSGVRTKSAGTIPWQIRHPRPGLFHIKNEVSCMDPFGTWTPMGSNGSGYMVSAPIPDASSQSKSAP